MYMGFFRLICTLSCPVAPLLMVWQCNAAGKQPPPLLEHVTRGSDIWTARWTVRYGKQRWQRQPVQYSHSISLSPPPPPLSNQCLTVLFGKKRRHQLPIHARWH
jgi:hypothetical protein